MNFLLQVEHTLNKIMRKNNDQKHCRLLRTKIVNLALRVIFRQELQLKIFRQEHRAKKRLQK